MVSLTRLKASPSPSFILITVLKDSSRMPHLKPSAVSLALLLPVFLSTAKAALIPHNQRYSVYRGSKAGFEDSTAIATVLLIVLITLLGVRIDETRQRVQVNKRSVDEKKNTRSSDHSKASRVLLVRRRSIGVSPVHSV